MSLLLLFNGGVGFVQNVIDTGRYSQHPINCMMSGTEVVKEGWRRRTEWSIPNDMIKETPTAKKSAARQITLPAGRVLRRGGWN